MPMTPQDLIAFLRDEMNIEEEIGPETELFSTGLLDSIAMMNLIAFIEERARIEVRPADVTLDNFDTVQRITDYALAGA